MLLRLWSIANYPYLARYIHTTVAINTSAATTPTKGASKAADEDRPHWPPTSIRTGVIARKRGMTALWNDQGVRIPVTVLQLENCQVTRHVETVRKNHTVYFAVQVAASDRPVKTCTRQMLGHFRKAGVPPKRIVREFPVTLDAFVPVGTTLSAIHFVPGQFVDVVANSIGKGFQGPMKRWGYHGLPASHGVSISHRSQGSTGQHQDPGRVWPGKKMAGRMGNQRVTVQNLQVVRVDTRLDLVFVKGAVPGADNAHVVVRDAKKVAAVGRANHAKGLYEKVLPRGVDDLPFPAGTAELARKLPPVIEAPGYRRSPFVPPE